MASFSTDQWATYLARGVYPGKRFLVGGNWKCNGTTASVKKLVDILNTAKPISPKVEVVVCPIMLHIPAVVSSIQSDIAVGAQNVALNEKGGAFTGEVYAGQLKDFGLTWAITGHSERREMYGETNEIVGKKTKIAVDAGLNVMACIGEKLEAREGGQLETVLNGQLAALAAELTLADWAKVAIAYEPVWAIGTGVSASPAQAQETHAYVRGWIAQNVSPGVAAAVRIQYGGSVKGSTALELAQCPDIDGFLVGSASLKDDFLNIISAAGSV